MQMPRGSIVQAIGSNARALQVERNDVDGVDAM